MKWPLVGDASLMHYVVFLIRHGRAPYKDIIDINLPGTYFFEALAMRIFGSGAIGWRLYDLSLLGSALVASILLARPKYWFAGLFSGMLFSLVHLQDGLAQGGQRDLLMAVLLLWAYAAFFSAQQERYRIPMALLGGSLLGATITIKPVLLPLAVALILTSSYAAHRRQNTGISLLLWSTIGIVSPVLAAFAWLHRYGAADAFLHILVGLIPLHAQLGRQPVPFLLSHALSPISLLSALWLILQFFLPQPRSAERLQLLIGLVATGLAYIIQGKGYPYQRYPLLAILLVLIGLDVHHALEKTGPPRRLAILIAFIACLVLAPRFAWLTTSFSPNTPFQDALSRDLADLAPPNQLSGQVQCIDTFGGCIGTLNELHILQSTGFLYDCYLFTAPSSEREQYRSAFWQAYVTSRPKYIVVTNQFCFADARGFDKIGTWNQWAADLQNNYTLSTRWKSLTQQHWWSRRDEPAAFEIYTRNQGK